MDVNVCKLEENLQKLKKDEFSFFDIVKSHETLVSEWLAFIFNPIKNGIGNKPIKILLNLLGEEKIDLDGQEFISTKTEVCIDEMRRIDILIDYENTLIVIENKIGSDENDNQTEAYFNYISNTVKDKDFIKYVYLKPAFNSSVPIKQANDKEDGFVIVTYHNLLNELSKITKNDFEDKRKYKYLEEFIKSGERFMDKKIEFNDKIRCFIKNKSTILKVKEEYDNQNKILKNNIRNNVLNKLNHKIYSTDVTGKELDRDYMQFYKKNWNCGKSYNIHYEILFKSNEENGEKGFIAERYLLGESTIEANIEVHIEGNFEDGILERIKEKGVELTLLNKQITKLFTSEENKETYEKIKCDFSNPSAIESSISNLVEKISKIKDKYEKTIDEIMEL